MSGTTIEPATVDDVELLRQLAAGAFQEDYELYGSKPPGIETSDWHEALSKTGHYFKILYEGEVAGGIGLISEGSAQMEVKIFFIDERFQGKGIGSQVMFKIETEYANVNKWRLVTPYKAFRNHHFYEKLGYRKTGEIQPDPNREFRVFQYVKEI